MRVYVVPAQLGPARKAIVQLGDDVIVAYDPSNGGSLEQARNVAARINSEWTAERAQRAVGATSRV